MQQSLDELLSLLDLENLEVNLFRGRSPEGDSQRVFGGQVVGQALAIQADGVGPEELALISTEMAFYKDDLCGVTRRVKIHELARDKPRHLDIKYLHTLGITEATGSAPIALEVLKAPVPVA